MLTNDRDSAAATVVVVVSNLLQLFGATSIFIVLWIKGTTEQRHAPTLGRTFSIGATKTFRLNIYYSTLLLQYTELSSLPC